MINVGDGYRAILFSFLLWNYCVINIEDIYIQMLYIKQWYDVSAYYENDGGVS